MDPDGCADAPLWCTDNVFEQGASEPCQSPLVAFITTLGLLTIIKIYVNSKAWKLWFRRQATLKSKNKLKPRYPIVPTLSAAVTVGYLMILILVSTNKMNAFTGSATALYSLMSIIWAISVLFLIKKLIRLGRAMIPLATGHRGSFTAMDSSSSTLEGTVQFENKLRILDTLDPLLKLLVTLIAVNTVTTFIAGFVLTLADPFNGLWPRLSFGLIGCFGVILALTLNYHLERLIQASQCFVAILEQSSRNDDVTKVSSTIYTMRLSQVIWVTAGTCMAVPHFLIAVGVIRIRWYVVICLLGIETFSSSFLYYSTKPARKAQARDEGVVAPLVAFQGAIMASPNGIESTPQMTAGKELTGRI